MSGWRDVLTVLSTIDHRVSRLAGDEAALADAMREARAGAAVDGWAREAHRIAMELADLLTVIERVKPDGDSAQDTDVIPLDAIAEPSTSDKLLDIAQRVHDMACQPGIAAELRAIALAMR